MWEGGGGAAAGDGMQVDRDLAACLACAAWHVAAWTLHLPCDGLLALLIFHWGLGLRLEVKASTINPCSANGCLTPSHVSAPNRIHTNPTTLIAVRRWVTGSPCCLPS